MSDFEIENEVKDLIDIKRFVENAFLNHEVQFQENKPAGVVMDNLILNPNIEGFTEDVFFSFKKKWILSRLKIISLRWRERPARASGGLSFNF
ncbi:hypothetical protein [Flavobacterium soyae]|uniref:hypothetical protein n=1 Tax=Flavobacterium soyae TaxID=2903098 RepID=UPI001E49E537|nr:hypothetical protein [Flavobacterium soyae]MCD9575702.1 hypothetical protein [Flavobacterium soyae]